MDEAQIVDRGYFREAMARFGAGVCIITTTTPEGDIGITVSAVCSVTDDPPTLLVCINRSSGQYDNFASAGIICINVLSHEQEELSLVFAGKGNLSMRDRFTLSSWQRLTTGAPVLENATASLDCRIEQSLDVGTHTVFFCRVQAIKLGNSCSGLIYHGRAYHPITGKPS